MLLSTWLLFLVVVMSDSWDDVGALPCCSSSDSGDEWGDDLSVLHAFAELSVCFTVEDPVSCGAIYGKPKT